MRIVRGMIMPERSVKVPLPNGQLADGVEVPVDETTERWSEVTLEDGTVLRVKTTVVSAMRVAGQYDQEGHPVYVIKSAPVIMVVSSPDQLKVRKQ
jgi:hypothetical protein